MSISFLKDWKDDQGRLRAIPHINTKNESFLRTARLFQQMGVKNYAFPLALYDPDLAHVDVHDLEDDTAENEHLRRKVQIEARRNVWYFLRECVRIYEQGGSPVKFRLDRGSAAMAWSFINGLDYCGMQPRQTGKAQPLKARILSTSGWIRMGDVTLDTEVITPSGDIAKVVGIYPQGIKDIYRITLEDGETAECCAEHLWTVYSEQWDDGGHTLSLDEISQLGHDVYIPVKGSLGRLASIEYVGRQQAQCIEIDHPEHLYITDNYIATHNTVGALSLSAWVLYSSGYEFTLGMFCKDDKLRQENVKRVRSFGENLPKWWLAEDRFKDKKNTTELYYNAMRTHYVTMVAQKDPNQADLQARGASMPMLHIDEAEFCVNIGITYPTMLASTGTARENAKKNGRPHSNIITTTAGDPIKPECREAAKILDGAMPFNEKLYDVENLEKLHEIVEASSPQKMLMGVFSHLQLGYTNKWLKDKITRNRMTRDQVMRDYLNRRVSIQDDPVIPEATLAAITSSEKEADVEIVSAKFALYWYVPKEIRESSAFKQKPLVVGCDSSEMIGRDSTTLVGIDPTTLETVFTFRCSEGNINVVGVMIAQLLLRFPKIVWIPENKSSGTSLIDIVSSSLRNAGHNPFLRMFNWVVNNRHEREFASINIRDTSLMDTNVKRFFGIKTDKSKRDELYSTTLLEAADRARDKIRDKILIQELGSLTVRNGRVDHAVGGHDDTVIAWLLAMWFILNAKHLDLYGIKPGSVLSSINAAAPDKSRLNQEHQNKIRAKIEEIETVLRRNIDPSLRRVLESDINLYKSMVDNGPSPIPVTADDFNRDPRRFNDPVIVQQSKSTVSVNEVEASLRMLMDFA